MTRVRTACRHAYLNIDGTLIPIDGCALLRGEVVPTAIVMHPKWQQGVQAQPFEGCIVCGAGWEKMQTSMSSPWPYCARCGNCDSIYEIRFREKT